MIRRATQSDVEAVARLHRVVRIACLPYLPDLHTPAQDRCYFRDRVFPTCEVWVAETVALLGFCAFRPGWVDHLYVLPDRHGEGIGTLLLRAAMQRNAHLRLWVFQRNTRALRFYLAHGFRVIERTDGSGNEEKEPDALLAWENVTGPTSEHHPTAS